MQTHILWITFLGARVSGPGCTCVCLWYSVVSVFYTFFSGKTLCPPHNWHPYLHPLHEKFVLILFTQMSYSFHKITNNNGSKNKKREAIIHSLRSLIHMNHWYRVKVQNFMHEYCVKLLNATATLKNRTEQNRADQKLFFIFFFNCYSCQRVVFSMYMA